MTQWLGVAAPKTKVMIKQRVWIFVGDVDVDVQSI
jgi:hypothetical protein